MSTRSNIIFTEEYDYKTGKELTTENKAILYIHMDGYISYRLKEILAYISEYGYPYGDIQRNSADFVRNFDQFPDIEPNMETEQYKDYCRSYIEYIYVFSQNSIDIFDDLLQLRYSIVMDTAIGEEMLFNIDDEKLKQMDKAFKEGRETYKGFNDAVFLPVRELFKK